MYCCCLYLKTNLKITFSHRLIYSLNNFSECIIHQAEIIQKERKILEKEFFHRKFT